MTIAELLKGVAYQIVQGECACISAITDDSRKVTDGCLFVCIRGMRADGHRFIDEVACAGAAAVMIDEAQPQYPSGLTVIQVENTRKVLSVVAANFYGRPADRFDLIGVTGTNGKTSTTYFLETILTQAGRTTGIIGTVGARVGDHAIDVHYQTSTTPDALALQQIFAQAQAFRADSVVMEVSSHALTLHKVEGMTFRVGIFTNLTQDHLDFHGTMANYMEAKAKLFAQCRIGVLNADDPASARLMERHPCTWMTYGIEKECDLQAVHIEYLADGSSFDVEIDGVTEHFFLPVKGRFNIYNVLGAIGAALAMDIPVAVIRRGVAAITGVPGRIQSIPNHLGAHVLVDYAHTPDGLVNVINAVRESTKGKVVTLFGCGGDKDKTKRPIMGRIAGELSDHCIITSDNPRSEPPEVIISEVAEGMRETNCPFETCADRRAAIYRGIAMLHPGDALIIAGKGHEDYQIVGTQKLPFDDAQVAREALAEIGGGR